MEYPYSNVVKYGPDVAAGKRAERAETGESRQMQRARHRAESEAQQQKWAYAERRHRQGQRVERIRAREAREASGPSGYVLSYLAARTAVGRLRRFRNDAGKLVRLS